MSEPELGSSDDDTGSSFLGREEGETSLKPFSLGLPAAAELVLAGIGTGANERATDCLRSARTRMTRTRRPRPRRRRGRKRERKKACSEAVKSRNRDSFPSLLSPPHSHLILEAEDGCVVVRRAPLIAASASASVLSASQVHHAQAGDAGRLFFLRRGGPFAGARPARARPPRPHLGGRGRGRFVPLSGSPTNEMSLCLLRERSRALSMRRRTCRRLSPTRNSPTTSR